MDSNSNPYDKVAAIVFGCLRAGELQLIVLPGVGHANGGIPFTVPVEVVPFELRMPNTQLWIKVERNSIGCLDIVHVWKREQNE
jgi:hypothetical protein